MVKQKNGKSGGKGKAVTKQLRKAGDAAVQLARQPVVSDLVATALTGAAASLSSNKQKGAAGTGSAVGAGVKRILLDAARELLNKFEQSAPAERTLAKSKPVTGAKANSGAKAKTRASTSPAKAKTRARTSPAKAKGGGGKAQRKT